MPRSHNKNGLESPQIACVSDRVELLAHVRVGRLLGLIGALQELRVLLAPREGLSQGILSVLEVALLAAF